jgi:hypothetical protein
VLVEGTGRGGSVFGGFTDGVGEGDGDGSGLCDPAMTGGLTTGGLVPGLVAGGVWVPGWAALPTPDGALLPTPDGALLPFPAEAREAPPDERRPSASTVDDPTWRGAADGEDPEPAVTWPGATSTGPRLASGEYGLVWRVAVSTLALPTESTRAVAPVASRQSPPTPAVCVSRRTSARLTGRLTNISLSPQVRT